MKILLALLTILSSFSANAKSIFACEATTKILVPGTPLHFRLDQNEDYSYLLTMNGSARTSDVGVLSAVLKQLPEYLRCEGIDEKCLESAAGGNMSFRLLADVIAIAKIQARDLDDHASTLAKLDIGKIAIGNAYIFGRRNRAQKPGIYEYYGQDGQLLGRYFFNAEVMDCIDRAEPSDDVDELLNKL